MNRKYFLEVIQQEGDVESKALYEYTDWLTCLIAYFNTLHSSLSNASITFVRCTIKNEQGGNLKSEYWQASEEQDTTKYYLAQVQYGTQETVKALFDYIGYKAALTAFYSVLSSTLSGNDFYAVTAVIEDRLGGEVKQDYCEKA